MAESADGDVVEVEPGAVVEVDGVQGVGPDAGDGGGADQCPHVEAGAQWGGAQDDQGADADGDEPVDHQGEGVGERPADVDGQGHLTQCVVGEREADRTEQRDAEADRGGTRQGAGVEGMWVVLQGWCGLER